MSDSSFKQYPEAQVKKQPFISFIWLIPLVALIVGGWLMYKVITEKGPTVVIDFENARGIEEGRTRIRYKDVDVGKIKDIKLIRRASTTETGENLLQDRALVTAELKSFMYDYLGEDTVFWVVRPRVTMGEVSGLSTLFSGFYIEMDPGTDRKTRKEIYTGLDRPPKITSYDRGKVIKLNSKTLGSINEGSPIYYHQLKVGEVIDSDLNMDTNSIDISIYIQDKYAHKVRSNTRFWNVSGLDVNVTPSGGVSAKMESLTAFVIGGIAFETPKEEKVSAELTGDTVFPLYTSYDDAQEGTKASKSLHYVMHFDDTLFGLAKHSTVEYQGVQVGRVENILLQVDNQKGDVKTAVHVSLFTDKLSGQINKQEAEVMLKKLVERGLHGQLQTSSLLTGAQYIALVYPDNKPKQALQLAETSQQNLATFPTTAAASSILNFDASELTQELTKTVREVRHVVSSNDVKQIIKATQQLAGNINKITKDLNDKGISGELVSTLKQTRQTILEIEKTATEAQTVASSVKQAVNSAQKTMVTAQNTINQSLGEDSALQYKLQVMLDDLSETANSFSVLADTLQRKPNAVIVGK